MSGEEGEYSFGSFSVLFAVASPFSESGFGGITCRSRLSDPVTIEGDMECLLTDK